MSSRISTGSSMNLWKRWLNLFVMAADSAVMGFGVWRRFGAGRRDSRGFVGILGSSEEWSCDLDIVNMRYLRAAVVSFGLGWLGVERLLTFRYNDADGLEVYRDRGNAVIAARGNMPLSTVGFRSYLERGRDEYGITNVEDEMTGFIRDGWTWSVIIPPGLNCLSCIIVRCQRVPRSQEFAY